MKKILLFLISLFMLPIMVSAQEYRINDLDLTIDIPENYIVITRDNYKGSETLTELGVDEEYMEEFFYSLSSYIDAYDEENKKEFFLVAHNTQDKDTDLFTEEDVETFKQELMSSLPEYLTTKDDIKELKINDSKYFSIGYFDSTYELYVRDYYYVYKNIVYIYKIQAASEFTEDDLKDFEKIIETVDYSDEKITLLENVADEEEQSVEKDKFSINKNIILIAALAIIIIILLIIIIKKLIKMKHDKNKEKN